MENFTSLTKFLLGLLIGGWISLIPNNSFILISLGITGLGLGEEGLLGAFISNTIFKSLIEGYLPSSSGDALIGMTAAEEGFTQKWFAPHITTKNIIWLKTIAVLIGLPLGLMVGYFNLPLLAPQGVSIGAIVIAVILIFCYFYFTNNEIEEFNYKSILLFLAITSIWTLISYFLSIPYPVLTLGLCLFIIPNNVSKKEEEREDKKFRDHFTPIRWVSIPLLLASSGAGVNFNVANTTLNHGAQRIYTHLFVESLIEFIAIGRLCILGGSASGITQIGSEIQYANIFFVIAGTTISIVTAKRYTSVIGDFLYKNSPFLEKVGLVVAVATVVITAKLFSPILIGLGILFSKFSNKVPDPIKGLMYLGVVVR